MYRTCTGAEAMWRWKGPGRLNMAMTPPRREAAAWRALRYMTRLTKRQTTTASTSSSAMSTACPSKVKALSAASLVIGTEGDTAGAGRGRGGEYLLHASPGILRSQDRATGEGGGRSVQTLLLGQGCPTNEGSGSCSLSSAAAAAAGPSTHPSGHRTAPSSDLPVLSLAMSAHDCATCRSTEVL